MHCPSQEEIAEFTEFRRPTLDDILKAHTIIEAHGHAPYHSSFDDDDGTLVKLSSYSSCKICKVTFYVLGVLGVLGKDKITQCDNGAEIERIRIAQMREKFATIARKRMWDDLSQEERDDRIDLAILIGDQESP